MTALCEGKCGKTVTEAGKWCPSCFFDEPVGPRPMIVVENYSEEPTPEDMNQKFTVSKIWEPKPDPPRPSAIHECGSSHGKLVCTLPKGHSDWHEFREGTFVHGSWAPDPIRPSQDLQSLRFEIHAASFHLAFGTEPEKAQALDKLSHLVQLLRNNPPSGA